MVGQSPCPCRGFDLHSSYGVRTALPSLTARWSPRKYTRESTVIRCTEGSRRCRRMGSKRFFDRHCFFWEFFRNVKLTNHTLVLLFQSWIRLAK